MNAAEQVRLLDQFATYKQGWDSYNGAPISPVAIQWAKVVLARLGHGWQPVPCSDGSVQLEWHADGVDMEMVIEEHK